MTSCRFHHVRRFAQGVLLSVAWLCLVVDTRAVERHLDFLHALQARGYGKLAVEYVNSLAARTDLPEDVRSALDLELAASLRVAGAETENADEAEQLYGQAQATLDKFLTAHAKDPRAAAGCVAYGDFEFGRSQQLLSAAASSPAKDKQAALREQARTALLRAKPKFQQAVELYAAQLGNAPKASAAEEPAAEQAKPEKTPPKKPPAKKPVTKPAAEDSQSAASTPAKKMSQREALEEDWLDARFKLVATDFHLARTYSDQYAADRKKALQAAAAGFDQLFQQFRANRIGMFAHMWHGKTLEELGDVRTALDVYDEVLINAPDQDSPRVEPAVEALFAEVQRSRLKLLAKQKEHGRVVEEAKAWMQGQRPQAKRTAGYQGIALELAKAELALAEELKGEVQRKAVQSAVVSLADIAKIPSEHQREAILLRNKHTPKKDAQLIRNFDEALALAGEAAAEASWADAATAYKRAIELATVKEKDKALAARYQLARSQYFAGDLTASLETAETLAREAPEHPQAPPAAALAVGTALNLYAKAEDRTAARERLQKVADYTISQWPQRAEADDARIALGRAYLAGGEFAKALPVLESVNAASESYVAAVQLSAQTRWRQYLEEKRKPEDKRDDAALKEGRDKVIALLEASLKDQRVVSQPVPSRAQPLLDAQLLLAEVRLEGGQAAEATQLLAPLAERIKGSSAKGQEAYVTRVLAAAIRGHVAQRQFAQADEVAQILGEAGEDSTQVNGVLTDLAITLRAAWKQADEKYVAAEAAADSAASEAASKEAASLKELLVRALERAAPRQMQPLARLAFLAETCLEAGLTDLARQQFQGILVAVQKDEAQMKANAKTVTRVRAQLIGLLRTERKFEEALVESDALLKENPNSLDAMMEKGRLLQELTQTDDKHFDAAIAHWTRVRTALQRSPRKPPEYYEAVYKAAYCLVAQGGKKNDRVKSQQAEQLLKSALILSPSLDGPQSVERYRTLMQMAVAQQKGGAAPSPKP